MILSNVFKRSKVWRTATEIKNYVLSMFSSKSVLRDEIGMMVMKNGMEFEKSVVSMIKRKMSFVYIKNGSNEDTIRAMKNGIPVIFQGYLESSSTKLCGRPDILIRSDYIEKLITNPPLVINYPCKLSEKYHYRVIDIKYTTLHLSSNMEFILRSSKMQAYKMQLVIYNLLLSDVQGFFPPEAYLLGRGWMNVKGGVMNCFNRLGPVNFVLNDKDIIELAVSKFSGNERNIEENNISEVYKCGVQQCNNALKMGITRWEDSRLTGELLGFKGLSCEIVNNMLYVNRREKFSVMPLSISMPCRSVVEYYIDFEIVGDIILDNFENMPNSVNDSRVYMVGLLCVVNSKPYEFKTFVVNDFSLSEERLMMNNVMSYMYKKNSEMCVKNPLVYHWGHIEKSCFRALCNRHNKVRWSNPNFINMCEILRVNKVGIKGVFNYRLKDIGRVLYKNGLISNIWESDNMSGKSSLLSIKKISEESRKENKKFIEHVEFNDLIRYNKSDVMVMYDIIEYFRKMV